MQKSISLFNYSKSFNSNQVLDVKKFIENPSLDLTLDYYYINLNLTYNELLENSKIIVNNLIYKLYYYKKIYFLFTGISLLRLENIPKLSKFLHESLTFIENYLYIEQLLELLKMTSTIYEYPSWVNHLEDTISKSNLNNIKLDLLNENQLKAVKSINGPNILLAPAGSGKTKTLVNRIVYLINKGIKDDNILVLAFNKKAADELIMRLNNFNIMVNIKTFHAFGNVLIKENYDYDFVNGDDFSDFKNNLINKNDVDNQEWLDYQRYLNKQTEEKTYNFDDMIYLAIKLLLDNKILRSKIQKQYNYILIDEFQDLNKAQLLLVDIIAKPLNNIFVVGDDDQMIYRFRGSSENSILNYEKHYGIANKNLLEINYRSPKNIVYHASQVISYNKNRENKNIKAFSTNNSNLELIIEDDMEHEAKVVLDYLKTHSNVTVLYRYNTYGDYLKIFLEQNNISVASSRLDFLDTEFGKLLFDYLKLIFENNPSSQVIRRCLYNYDSQIPYYFINQIFSIEDLFNLEKMKNLDTIEVTSIHEFIKNVKKLKLNESSLITLIKIFKLEEKIDSLDSGKEAYKMVLGISKLLKNINNLYHYLINNNLNTNKKGIVLNTIHKTKGNEYDNVVFYHVVNNSSLIEDERRLFYVAVTRTKGDLLITTIDSEKSIFIKEYFLDKNLTNYSNMDLKLDLIRLENQIKKRQNLDSESTSLISDRLEIIKKELYYRSLLT